MQPVSSKFKTHYERTKSFREPTTRVLETRKKVMRIKKKTQTEKFQIADLRRKADQGNADAQYSVGMMYGAGQGVPKDYAMARQWWEKAAAQGKRGGRSTTSGSCMPWDRACRRTMRWRASGTRKPMPKGTQRRHTLLGCCIRRGTACRNIPIPRRQTDVPRKPLNGGESRSAFSGV